MWWVDNTFMNECVKVTDGRAESSMRINPMDDVVRRKVRRVQDRSVETRARLVDSAIQCLSKFGYAGATTPLIAETAGVTRGALQHHFASRTDLDLAVIDHVAEALNFRFDAESLSHRPLTTRVSEIVGAYWTTFESPLFRAAMHIWLALVDDPSVAQRVQAHLEALQQRVDVAWRVLFADTKVPARKLSELRRVVMGAARGCAIEQMFHPRRSTRAERERLEAMMLRELQATCP